MSRDGLSVRGQRVHRNESGSCIDITLTAFVDCSASWVQPQHQRHRMLRRGLEAVVQVEVSSALVERVDQQRTHAGVLSDARSTQDCILEKSSAQLDALSSLVDGETPQDKNGYGVWHVPPHATGRRLARNRTGGQRVIPHDAATVVCDHEGSTGAA